MNKKRYILVVEIILIGIVSLIILNNKLDNKETVLDEVKLKDNKVDKNSFAVMIQKEDKTGYDVYEENTWPTDGYTFNSELSGCIDNYGNIIENSLAYNEDTNIITVDTGVTSSCYVYFDIRNNALGQYIIDNSISGLDKNFIGTDTLYRFSGTSGNTGINNYVCLGISTKCASGSENMYRIIGVEPSTGYVKVIKETIYSLNSSLGWNSSTGVTWPNSELFDTMNSYYNSLSFKNMIVEHTWNIGDIASDIQAYIGTRSSVIDYENNTPNSAYVGILSMSDYYMAYREDKKWDSDYSNYQKNWIHLRNNGTTTGTEWTMTRYNQNYAWSITNGGAAKTYSINSCWGAVRPTFYLDKNVYITNPNATGTSIDPFIVSQ